MTWTYEKSGVSLERGDNWVETIKKIVSAYPKDPNVRGGIGGFNGLYSIGNGQYIAGCCDGVGTKVEIARAANLYDGLGQDLLGMNVNDLITCGARPLFFLDYMACGKFEPQKMAPVIKSLVEGCQYCGCALLGGETAEMPDVYDQDGFDLAGFAVGLVHENEIIDGAKVKEGDLIIGIASSGVHSNGFSLVRKALAHEIAHDLQKEGPVKGETLAQTLLKPTRLYVPQAQKAISTGAVKAMAHITGSGLEDNINRVFPEGLKCHLDYSSWKRPAIFDLIASKGVEEAEMRRVFNLGIGFVFIVAKEDETKVKQALSSMGENPITIGYVAP